MTFATFDEIIAAAARDGQVLDAPFYKVTTTSETQGVWHSAWRAPGFPAAGGDGAASSGTPGAGGTALTLANGSLGLGWANASPLQKYLTTLDAAASGDCTLMLYDRLVSVSGISIVGTGTKNVNSIALPRYTDGVGVEAWLEVTTQTATSSCVVSMNSYTDQSGNAASAGTSITFPAAATNVDTFVGPLPLADGDYGIRSVETLSVATAPSAGVVNLVLIKPLAFLGLRSNSAAIRDSVAGPVDLRRVYDGASLGIAILGDASAIFTLWGHVRAVYG